MKRKYSKAIRKIAREHKVPEEMVYSEIQTAINIGYNNLDPKIQEYWRHIVPDGEMPTPEQLIEILANKLKK